MIRIFYLVVLLIGFNNTAMAQCQHNSDEKPVMLVMGDSLSAAYGMDMKEGWVNLLRQRLSSSDQPFDIINASISGDTTSGGLSRLKDALVKFNPSVVVIELGGNDGLRGIPLKTIRRNLQSMITMSQAANAQAVLLGMRIPSNYGSRYTDRFNLIYEELAETFQVPKTDFFMQAVAQQPELMQADGIHPNVEAQAVLLDTAWPAISQAIERVCKPSKAR